MNELMKTIVNLSNDLSQYLFVYSNISNNERVNVLELLNGWMKISIYSKEVLRSVGVSKLAISMDEWFFRLG